MTPFIILTLLILALLVWFVAVHSQPLSHGQVLELARRRRKKRVNAHFAFVRGEVGVCPVFKSRMKSQGGFFELSESLANWPGLAAGLLKYKKHEWILVAFERQQSIVLVWMNKGLDNCSVSLLTSLDSLVGRARALGCTSLLVSHNHPNSNPRLVNCTAPSEIDLSSARQWSCLTRAAGLNLVEFVCERGIYYEYWRDICETFHPVDSFCDEINMANRTTWSTNLALHVERLFS